MRWTAALLARAMTGVALAQSPAQPPGPRPTIPERIEPAPRPNPAPPPGQATPPVIRPPAGIDPGIRAPVPEPNPNTTPVIPPPAASGAPQPR